MSEFVGFITQTVLLTLLGFALINGMAFGILRLRSTTEAIPSLLSMENRGGLSTTIPRLNLNGKQPQFPCHRQPSEVRSFYNLDLKKT